MYRISANRFGRWSVLLPAVLLLAGCTASWRAPVESRGAHPADGPRAAPSTRPATRSPTSIPPAYRVRTGDTLFGIAWDYGLDYREIARWNDIRSPYRIFAGQSLRLRAPTTRAVPAAEPVKPAQGSNVKRAERPSTPPRASTPSRSASSKRLAWRWPAGGRVSSTFKPSDPLRKGIKIAGREGSTVSAAEDGRVVYSGSGLIGYGRLIIIKHNDKFLSAYGHNRDLLVAEGEKVTKGQKIAAMGRSTDGKPLLHFEIRRNGKPVDPLRLLPRR